MVLEMLPDTPDLLEEIEQWKFYDYIGHFEASGLDFSQLAIEAYSYAPPELREAFERKINGMRIILEQAGKTLRLLYDAGELQAFSHYARMTGVLFRGMMEDGNAIIHGSNTSSQTDIDKIF